MLRVVKPAPPTLSILTPVRNGAPYIEACLRHVAEQDPDAEHVVVDGGSTDGTVGILRAFAASHPSVRWISEPDGGQSEALNKGVRLATGSLLGWLNVDDYYEPGVLRRAVRLAADLPEPAFLVANCNVWDETGRLKYVNRPRRLDVASLLLGWAHHPHPVNPAAYFFHRNLLDRIGPFDEEEKFAQDVDFVLRAVQEAHVVYVDETWGNYRFLPGTLTYQDTVVTGESADRMKRLLERHRRGLPAAARARHETLRLLIVLRRIAGRARRMVRPPGR